VPVSGDCAAVTVDAPAKSDAVPYSNVTVAESPTEVTVPRRVAVVRPNVVTVFVAAVASVLNDE
jgi:hypothetical protein